MLSPQSKVVCVLELVFFKDFSAFHCLSTLPSVPAAVQPLQCTTGMVLASDDQGLVFGIMLRSLPREFHFVLPGLILCLSVQNPLNAPNTLSQSVLHVLIKMECD